MLAPQGLSVYSFGAIGIFVFHDICLVTVYIYMYGNGTLFFFDQICVSVPYNAIYHHYITTVDFAPAKVFFPDFL